VDDGESRPLLTEKVTEFKCAASARSDASPIELFRSSRLQPCALQQNEHSCRRSRAPLRTWEENHGVRPWTPVSPRLVP
jgi:hypothetical protein